MAQSCLKVSKPRVCVTADPEGLHSGTALHFDPTAPASQPKISCQLLSPLQRRKCTVGNICTLGPAESQAPVLPELRRRPPSTVSCLAGRCPPAALRCPRWSPWPPPPALSASICSGRAHTARRVRRETCFTQRNTHHCNGQKSYSNIGSEIAGLRFLFVKGWDLKCCR